MTRSIRACLCIALLLLVRSVSAAQSRATTGDLTGVAVDQSKAVLPGVVITATNMDTNLIRSSTTGETGRFSLPALPPGSYTLRAELPGFAPRVLDQVIVTLGSAVEVELMLALGGTQEAVFVAAESPIIDIRKTAIATVVSQAQIENLPINGRNFISFSIITPGVTTDRTPQQGASATSGLTFAGQRARSNNITVDGVDNNDQSVGSVRAVFSQEAVREFQVLTNSYSAEFGRASGGVVNIITKSGANTPAGSAFWYFRDETLNAKEHFEKFDPFGAAITRDKAPYGQQQFGGTLGGPIARGRTFFFLSFERLDIEANNFVTIDDATPVTVFGQAFGTPAAILRRAGFPVETGNVPYAVAANQFLAKIDQAFGASHNLAVRYNYAGALNENIEPFGGIVARSRGGALDSADHMVAAAYTGVLSSTIVNELRLQYANRDQSINALDPRCGGACVSDDQGGPTLEIPGVASVGRQRFTPQIRHGRLYQALDTLSVYRGPHQLKAGFDVRHGQAPGGSLPLHFGGRYIFQPITAALAPLLGLPGPISAVQALALNLPLAYVQGYGNPLTDYTSSDVSLFAQDDWRITPKLTVKLGVRYQRQLWNDYEFRVRGIAPYRFPSDNNDVAPRLSLAWDPAGDRKTSVHAAYGMFYDAQITGLWGITRGINGSDGVRTLVATGGTAIAAFRSASRKLPEPATAYPSLAITTDPGLQTPYSHHASVGIDRELPGQMALATSFVYARGFNQLGTIDYNPVINPATGNRPEDVVGAAGPMPGSSASILQYTSFGETWYRGLTATLSKRFTNRYQFLGSYTLSKAEDNSTDFQSAFIPQNNGRGRNPQDLRGVPLGFDPDAEKGPSTQDQRHRFVLSGTYLARGDVQLSAIVTIASGRPFNILAGTDLNGDGNGGAFPPDRARVNVLDANTSVARNAGTLPGQATMDVRVSRRFPLGGKARLEGIFEVFNLFNRTNFDLTDNGANIFGTGSFPGNPVPTYGMWTQAGPPRQIQLAGRVSF
jgi:hypothetical protein